MPKRNSDLHGSAPDKCETALLIVDVINDLDFPEAKQLLRYVPSMARRISVLRERAREAGILHSWRWLVRCHPSKIARGRSRGLVARACAANFHVA